MLSGGGRGLYAITDGARDDLLARAEAILAAGAVLLQYRDKLAAPNQRVARATALQSLCAKYAVPLIVNDHVDLALAVGAAGVHLGEFDGDIASARQILGNDAIIGVSCYDSLDRARAMARQGASYLAFGSFFASRSKPTAPRAAPQQLQRARELGLPLVAIGGITPDNGADLIRAGADYLAIVSGVFGAADPAAAARDYGRLFASS